MVSWTCSLLLVSMFSYSSPIVFLLAAYELGPELTILYTPLSYMQVIATNPKTKYFWSLCIVLAYLSYAHFLHF